MKTSVCFPLELCDGCASVQKFLLTHHHDRNADQGNESHADEDSGLAGIRGGVAGLLLDLLILDLARILLGVEGIDELLNLRVRRYLVSDERLGGPH